MTDAPYNAPRLASARPRDIAVDALRDLRNSRRFVRDGLDRLISQRNPAPPDAALATELAFGVVRHALTLDRLIERVFHGRSKRLDAAISAVLRVGAYQLVWLDRVPPFAAVHAAVDQAKRLAGPKAGGLVNALLRQILRRRHERILDHAPPDPRRAVRTDRKRWRTFDIDLFPDPDDDRATYLSLAMSHPLDLVRRYLTRFGPAHTEQICLAGSLRPPLVLRPNRLRTDPGRLVARLGADNVEADWDRSSDAVFLIDSVSVRELSVIAEGLCQPQDATAQAAVRACPPKPGQKVLDLCAGQGTKTIQMAELMDNQGLILASDRADQKLTVLHDACRRMGISCVQAAPADRLADAADRYGPFDLALVDAPCSNSGVPARRPEARYRITPHRIASLNRTQSGLLAYAAEHVLPGGRIIYATCSIEAEENEKVVQRFLEGRAAWRLVRSKLTLPIVGDRPTGWRDGGFTAVIARTEKKVSG